MADDTNTLNNPHFTPAQIAALGDAYPAMVSAKEDFQNEIGKHEVRKEHGLKGKDKTFDADVKKIGEALKAQLDKALSEHQVPKAEWKKLENDVLSSTLDHAKENSPWMAVDVDEAKKILSLPSDGKGQSNIQKR